MNYFKTFFDKETNKYRISSRIFFLLLFASAIYIIYLSVSFSVNRLYLWEKLKNDFIATSGKDFNSGVFNAMSLSTFIISFGTIAIFIILTIFIYKKNGCGYLYSISWIVIWIFAIAGLWFNKVIPLQDQIVNTLIGLLFISSLIFITTNIKNYKKDLYYSLQTDIYESNKPVYFKEEDNPKENQIPDKSNRNSLARNKIKSEKDKIMKEIF